MFDQLLRESKEKGAKGLHFRRFLNTPAHFLNKPSVPMHNV